jgi:hypothetical protein
MDQTNSILEQYNTSVQAYEDKFNGVDDFAKRYGLTDFRLGLNRLKQGVVQVSNTQGTVILFTFFYFFIIVFSCMEFNAKI